MSAVGTYLEVPDDVVARIPPALPIRRRSRRCSSDWRATPASARRWGSAHARTRASPSRRAPPRPAYAAAIDGVLALRADPTRTALARWAAALQAEGVRPRDVRRGSGLRYAEALAEIAGSG